MTASTSQDQALRLRAEAVIPGGMYGHQSAAALPDDYPQFFSRGEGAYLWDVNGSRYLDLMCAYGPQLFGYSHEGIDAAAIDAALDAASGAFAALKAQRAALEPILKLQAFLAPKPAAARAET